MSDEEKPSIANTTWLNKQYNLWLSLHRWQYPDFRDYIAFVLDPVSYAKAKQKEKDNAHKKR